MGKEHRSFFFQFYVIALQKGCSCQGTCSSFFKFCVSLLKKISVDHAQIYLGSISISAERKIIHSLDLPVRANICPYSEEKIESISLSSLTSYPQGRHESHC